MPPTTMKKPAERPTAIKPADAPPDAPPVAAQQPTTPTPPGPLESYGPDYAALSGQLADLNAKLAVSTTEANNLAVEVGDLGDAPVRLEALELLGSPSSPAGLRTWRQRLGGCACGAIASPSSRRRSVCWPRVSRRSG